MVTQIRNFWDSDSVVKPYQMGPHKHRLYLLTMLDKRLVRSLLDVGCGTAPIYEIIKKCRIDYGYGLRKYSIKKYKGTDYSEGMIESCKQQFSEGDFEVEDARYLKEKDNSWDCVLLLHTLDHVNDYKAVIKEAARVAKRYVCIVLWRAFADDGQVHINDRNMIDKKEEEEPWLDSYLMQFPRELLEKEFKRNKLKIEETAEGEQLNSGQSKWNFLFLLSK